ncbi:hypothetical protein Tco_0344635 [Tanacetum coccineum]
MYGALILDEMINQDIKYSKAYKTYLDFATGKGTPKKARKFKKVASPSKKLSLVLEEEPAEKPKQAKKPAKKSTTVPTAGVVIKDTPSVSVSKKKALTKADRGKGMYLLSEAALLEAVQLKKTLKKSKLETHKLHASGSGDGVGSQPKVPDEYEDKTTGTDKGTGTKPGVPDVPKYQSESENKSRGDSDDDSNDDDSDDVTNDDDDDVDSDAYGDNEASDIENTNSDDEENPNLNQNDDEEEDIKKKMTDVGQEKSYEQVKDDAHVTLTATHITQKTEGPMQSSFVSSNFASQFLNLDNVLPTDTEVVSMMNVKILPKEKFEFATLVIQSTIIKSLENVILAKSSSQPKSTYEAATSLTEFELKKILLDKMQKSKSYRAAQEHRDLYNTLVKSYKLDNDLFESYVKAYTLKRDREDKDKDEDLPAGSGQGLRKRKMSKDSAQAEESVFETADSEMLQNQGGDLAYVMNNLKIENLTQEHLVGPAFNLLKETCISRMELEYNFEVYRGRQVVPVNYFINNDLEFLKGGSSSSKYTTSTTKTKAAKYDDIQGIKDMVPSLCSPVKHDVFSTKIIIAVTHVKVMKWYDYGYLEENEVRREDQQLYKFREGDFPRLNLRDIEDMLLLVVQKKLFNMEIDVIFDLNVALWMFTRRVVILKRVEDLQLGVKSYQKKLNITKPETFRSDISNMTPYTAYNNPQGIIYLDKLKRNRLMHSDELYKLCDGTLTYVRSVLHDIASSLRMDYLPKRRWSKLDRKMSHIMIKLIDQQLFERRLMRNLEKFVGGREYGEDFRLLERTI